MTRASRFLTGWVTRFATHRGIPTVAKLGNQVGADHTAGPTTSTRITRSLLTVRLAVHVSAATAPRPTAASAWRQHCHQKEARRQTPAGAARGPVRGISRTR